MTTILACADPVAIRGDQLDPVWWQGRQWAVTSCGIECRDGTYVIEHHRLYDRQYSPDGSLGWCWPVQIAGKNWADINDFCTAFAVACAMHKPPKGKQYKPGEVRAACIEGIERRLYYEDRRAWAIPA